LINRQQKFYNVIIRLHLHFKSYVVTPRQMLDIILKDVDL